MSQTAALLLSIVIESVFAATLARTTRWSARAPAALAAALGTLATHPLVWFGVESGSELIGYGPALAAAESLAALLEAVFYRLLATPRLARALVFSSAANGFSLGVGLLLAVFGAA
jgi:hypothetical protein